MGASKSNSPPAHPARNPHANPRPPGGQSDILILSALDLLQGILLLHPPSRALFSREIYMNVSHTSPAPTCANRQAKGHPS